MREAKIDIDAGGGVDLSGWRSLLLHGSGWVTAAIPSPAGTSLGGSVHHLAPAMRLRRPSLARAICKHILAALLREDTTAWSTRSVDCSFRRRRSEDAAKPRNAPWVRECVGEVSERVDALPRRALPAALLGRRLRALLSSRCSSSPCACASTLAPASRASLSPMAIACSRLFTSGDVLFRS